MLANLVAESGARRAPTPYAAARTPSFFSLSLSRTENVNEFDAYTRGSELVTELRVAKHIDFFLNTHTCNETPNPVRRYTIAKAGKGGAAAWTA